MAASSRWSLRNIYLYLVCLITLIMLIVSAVGLVRAGVELAYPDPGFYDPSITAAKTPGTPTKAELEKQQAVQKQQSTRQSVLSLVGSIAMLLVAGPIYAYHWRKIEVELPQSRDDAPEAA